MSSRFSINSEADAFIASASELLQNLEKMFPRYYMDSDVSSRMYYMDSDVISRLKSSITEWCVVRCERVNKKDVQCHLNHNYKPFRDGCN